MASDPVTIPKTAKLELLTAMGSVQREVLVSPPRIARPDEIPIFDISAIHGSLEDRKELAELIKRACETTGFFYIKGHGIDQASIDGALNAAREFFQQTEEKKQLVSTNKGKFFNGYSGRCSSSVNPTEGGQYISFLEKLGLTVVVDGRESFLWRYDPRHDPNVKEIDLIPAKVKEWLQNEDYIWEGTAHLPGFKAACVKYWQECLQLSRQLVKVFALALELPESYFDPLVSHPGADGRFNHYQARAGDKINEKDDLGIGSHTDLQCFTLLWQDAIGGLQVLNNEGQWIKAAPIPGTLVVNIGDYLMRLTNDKFKSTVHRVFTDSSSERFSMPFFFGFNLDESCGVLPSCVDAEHPPKYESISCGEWCLKRYKQVMKY